MTEVHRPHLTDVTPAPHLPWARPTFPVFAHLVLHPTGSILIDTGVGVGVGHTFIDELYSPVHHDLDEALARHGIAVGDVTTIITSHLHFDTAARTTGSRAPASSSNNRRPRPRRLRFTPCRNGRSRPGST